MALQRGFKTKAPPGTYDNDIKEFNKASSEQKQKWRDDMKPHCDKFMESDEYKSGDTAYGGYIVCCDMYEFCGGMSGWIIFLIILLVIGCLAAGGAAFWFFYWRRKMGGRDIEKDSEKSSTKSEYDISVDTY